MDSSELIQHSGSPPDPSVVGQWELLSAEFQGAATHAALLPTNQVFAYGGSSLDKTVFAFPPAAEVLDLEEMVTRQLSMEGVAGDLWCGGHTFLPDGKLLFVGGTSAYPPVPDPFYGGLRQAYTFDPFDEEWKRLPDMWAGRWYPTLLRLADNRVLTISGLQYRDPQITGEQNILKVLFQIIFKMKDLLVSQQEVYNPETGSWDEMIEQRIFPLYPRLHLLPDGDVFYSGVFNTHYFTPGKYPSARWYKDRGQWVEVGGPHKDKNREEGISLLLALRPPDYRPQVLIAGGGQHNLPRIIQSILHAVGLDSWARKLARFATARKSVEWINLSEDEPRWQSRKQMHLPRIHANGVLLPDGKVLVVGGMPGHGQGDPERNVDYPILPSELYDLELNEWTMMDMPDRPRVYHSTALLLPDGRVIAMGGNPQARVIEHGIEIFSPPYLYAGVRPVITRAPQGLSYGESFSIRVSPARQVAQVVLMRPEVLTHVTNTDQRLLELEFRSQSDEKLEVSGPLNAAHMPQGYALLFALSQDGVPSVGHFVRVV